ncbi:hypothetical protein BASA61_000608 [Batrachochytrium salamandrivorans]|nr:hypothetical protein BASA60_011231 [Batrachochytrium salamandrivorans]KAH6562192.1 hypothetical protein BASA62_009333 [Batrachochytrium salamandrivorans]KAH6602931.1 hypothetical protein BASA61_000608 [Batrachochytrium salamandrivorans]KAH9270714.1 hypothetical protein BASA83_007074 [Batrachochytrium salamandrivorans]
MEQPYPSSYSAGSTSPLCPSTPQSSDRHGSLKRQHVADCMDDVAFKRLQVSDMHAHPNAYSESIVQSDHRHLTLPLQRDTWEATTTIAVNRVPPTIIDSNSNYNQTHQTLTQPVHFTDTAMDLGSNSQGSVYKSDAMPINPTSPSKRSFSMGFRRDCDKCQLGVPGHYSHLIERTAAAAAAASTTVLDSLNCTPAITITRSTPSLSYLPHSPTDQ